MPTLENEEKLLKKFEKIDEDWRHRVEVMGPAEIKAILVEVTQNEATNQEMKEDDEELAQAKAAYDAAGLGYKEATTMNKLKIKFAVRQLKNHPE